MPESASSSSATTSASSLLDDHDESVRIAVRALGDMRNNARASSAMSSQVTSVSSMASPSSPPLPSPAQTHEDSNSPDFVSRVSHFPIVNTALRAYEHGKASSRVVKYGAEMMESSVKTISRPVIERLPVNVNQLDEFACRQLDRLGRYRRASSNDLERMQTDEQDAYTRDHPPSPIPRIQAVTPPQSTSNSKASADRQGWLETNSPFVHPPPPPPTESRTPTPQSREDSVEQNQQEVVPRSRWQNVLLEAGGIGAAVSEESMRRLKYCLQWLQYATSHIDAQILILRDFMVSLQNTTSSSSSPDAIISATHMRTLMDVRRDVVHTIRQVVDVVSKYAGGALPEPARTRVRGFILHLPQRWASAAYMMADGPVTGHSSSASVGAAGGGTGRRSRASRYQHHRERGAGSMAGSNLSTPASSRASSPMSSPRIMPRTAGVPPTASAATQAAQRILTLATESLDMMRGVTGVVKESLDRADAWVERLRIVGLQRQQRLHDDNYEEGSPRGSVDSSPRSSHHHRRSDRHSLPTLSSTLSSRSATPAQGGTPYSSVPSTPVESALGLAIGDGPGLSAATSLSSLCLDGYETPRSSMRSLKGEQLAKRGSSSGSERDDSDMYDRNDGGDLRKEKESIKVEMDVDG
ncbi:hypothetical protein SERLA73DRAFT_77210 [Serpula lacrymans var. lacrymans S7.3]|uniref:Opi1-domain-containing protein n=2 Tax=Serpula lacrymans var. lacrymans TaxID=341189 RepID=F8Q9E7_SERL3|nr:uncharacterized protein SERLADRAFT_442066 [Serpula lacrymans var. lacrymans S7.9]EGN95202.1 hypothetical protein SERLA73DRAFT_77210 [Serpula lacrymans var. lacrymans S7.3]EGO20730.1 hypothetical protein SERLADRAFT_442066 [Serpula lacrymans var. lacrymans S7.9]